MFSYYYNTSVSLNENHRFSNRTYNYLYPSFKFYDSTLTQCISKLEPCAVTIDDQTALIKESNCLYHTVYIQNKHALYTNCLNSIKQSPHFVAEYPQGDLLGNYRTIVLTLPDILRKDILSLFVEGKYSEMYTSKQIDYIIPKTLQSNKLTYKNPAYEILKKNIDYKNRFFMQIKQDFDVEPKELFESNIDIELDYPPHIRSEIINFFK